ncbi:MAG: class I adenylate-forming enzyme family protein, partial [Streptosporangiaceae bacterium]
MYKSLYEIFCAGVSSQPEKIALIEGQTQLTHTEVAGRVRRLAGQLQSNGLRPGDRVVICAGNRIETVVGFWAAQAAGGVPVVISHEQSLAKIWYIIADSAAVALIALAPIAAGICGENRPPSLSYVIPVTDEDTVFTGQLSPVDVISDDLAALIYTSGSTGGAKGVMLSHANMMTALASLNEYLANTPGDVFLCVLPLAFDYGLYQMIMAFSMGATLVLERDMSLPLQVIKDISRHRCTVIPGVPVFFELLDRFSRFSFPDVSSVRCLTNTGAALLPTHIAAIQRLFPGADIYSRYGVTECKRCT